jgi:hypothetical protein
MSEQKDEAEPSLASAGSQADAWEIRRSDGALEALTPCVRMAEQILRCTGVGTILPLYRHPQPTLTDEEQLAIAWAAREADEWDEEDTPEVAAHAEALRGLAKRLF